MYREMRKNYISDEKFPRKSYSILFYFKEINEKRLPDLNRLAEKVEKIKQPNSHVSKNVGTMCDTYFDEQTIRVRFENEKF